MENLALYRKALVLVSYLEDNTEQAPKYLKEAEKLMDEIFKTLERRGAR